jgi:DNA-binding transcriptional regulator YdaS (Cro superfamily)
VEQGITPQQALTLAVNRIGSQAAMGRLLDITQAAVWKWLDGGMPLPAEHVLKVEAATGVPRHELRPDLYPRGLQDDVPFRPAASLGDGVSDVADETPDLLQRDDEWPVRQGKAPQAAQRKRKAAA